MMLHAVRPRLISLPGFKDAEPPKLDGFTIASSIAPKNTEWLWYTPIP
jgi:hypothetical protein